MVKSEPSGQDTTTGDKDGIRGARLLLVPSFFKDDFQSVLCTL